MAALQNEEDEKRRLREEAGSDAEAELESDKKLKEEAPAGDEEKPEGEEGEEPKGGSKEERQIIYEKQLAQLAADEASDEDEFVPLALKLKVNEYFA